MLNEIIDHCRVEIVEKDRAAWEAEIARKLEHATPPPSFSKAIDTASESFIFEIKRKAPSYRGAEFNVDSLEMARFYQENGAAAISVLTEPNYFGGSLSDLERVAAAVTVPVLRKDFIIDELQIAEAKAFGAAAVLLIAAVLRGAMLRQFVKEAERVGIDALVEVHTREELEQALDSGARIIGVNNRNLHTMEIDMNLGERILNQIPAGHLKVAESGFARRADITRFRMVGADAFLIGSSIMQSDDPARTIRELRG